MDEEYARRYIGDLYKIVNSSSILVVDHKGRMHRLYCPFRVQAIQSIAPDITIGRIYLVEAVKMALNLKEVYLINKKGFYYWAFIIFLN